MRFDVLTFLLLQYNNLEPEKSMKIYKLFTRSSQEKSGCLQTSRGYAFITALYWQKLFSIQHFQNDSN